MVLDTDASPAHPVLPLGLEAFWPLSNGMRIASLGTTSHEIARGSLAALSCPSIAATAREASCSADSVVRPAPLVEEFSEHVFYRILDLHWVAFRPRVMTRGGQGEWKGEGAIRPKSFSPHIPVARLPVPAAKVFLMQAGCAVPPADLILAAHR